MSCGRCYVGFACAAVAIAVVNCSGQPPPDLSASLKGIEKSKFLSCSGPPVLDYPGGSEERMSFVTNLKRGSTIGVIAPTAMAPESCSVDTVFQDNRLVSSNFSGDLSMCNLVFGPCLRK